MSRDLNLCHFFSSYLPLDLTQLESEVHQESGKVVKILLLMFEFCYSYKKRSTCWHKNKMQSFCRNAKYISNFLERHEKGEKPSPLSHVPTHAHTNTDTATHTNTHTHTHSHRHTQTHTLQHNPI